MYTYIYVYIYIYPPLLPSLYIFLPSPHDPPAHNEARVQFLMDHVPACRLKEEWDARMKPTVMQMGDAEAPLESSLESPSKKLKSAQDQVLLLKTPLAHPFNLLD